MYEKKTDSTVNSGRRKDSPLNPRESVSKAGNLKGSLTQFCPEDKEEEDDTPSNQTKSYLTLCSSLSHVIKTGWLKHHDDQDISSLEMNHFHSFRSQE